jgi:hypothetical protein
MEAHFRGRDEGYLADIVTALSGDARGDNDGAAAYSDSFRYDKVVTALSDDRNMHNYDPMFYDYEDTDACSYLTHDAAAALLKVPTMYAQGNQRYVILSLEAEASLKQLIRKEKASVVFWYAAQRGCLSTVATQLFVYALINNSAELSQLPASLVTIHRDVARVAARTGSWIKHTADVITLQVPELRWHHDVLFVYHDVIQCLADLLQDKDLCGPDTAWEFKERRTADGRYRIFGELSDGYWWKEVEAQETTKYVTLPRSSEHGRNSDKVWG